MPHFAQPPMTGARANRGAVILLVLVTVFLAAFLMTRFIQRAGTELLADAHAVDQDRLRIEAYSALEVTLAVLADFRTLDSTLYGPAQGWDDPLHYAGYEPAGKKTVEISFEDESGKISLPMVDQATLQLLFEQSGLARAEAEKASDALLVWMRKDYAPVSLDNDPQRYERADPPHKPPQRALESWDELAAVEHVREYFYDESGRPNDRWRWLAANASLFSFSGVNLNSATAGALAVSGLSASQATSLDHYFHAANGSGAPRYFRSAAEAASVAGVAGGAGRLGAEVQVLRINVTVRDGAAVFRMSAVVAPPGAPVAAPALTKADPAAPAKPAAVTPTADNVPAPRKKLDYPFRVLEIQEDLAPAEPPAEPAH
jgi:general secretion pathway protein K